MPIGQAILSYSIGNTAIHLADSLKYSLMRLNEFGFPELYWRSNERLHYKEWFKNMRQVEIGSEIRYGSLNLSVIFVGYLFASVVFVGECLGLKTIRMYRICFKIK